MPGCALCGSVRPAPIAKRVGRLALRQAPGLLALQPMNQRSQGWGWSVIRSAPGALLLSVAVIASGLEAHLPCQSTRPLSSTTQIEVWSCDTSKPTYCFMAVLHGVVNPANPTTSGTAFRRTATLQ